MLNYSLIPLHNWITESHHFKFICVKHHQTILVIPHFQLKYYTYIQIVVI